MMILENSGKDLIVTFLLYDSHGRVIFSIYFDYIGKVCNQNHDPGFID